MFYIAKMYNNDVIDVVLAGHKEIAKAYWQGKGIDYDKIEETMNYGPAANILIEMTAKFADLLTSGNGTYSKTVVMPILELIKENNKE